ncbi:MAG: chromate transporter [Clostridia bacterium]|nr:chromate transporter [Clostridia bacterium]
MKRTAGLFELFLTMLKIGLFTFGGGYAMIALLENTLVVRKKWIEREEFLDVVAIAESTPGPIAINAATYIGYQRKGVLGSVVSTLGVCLPSLVIIFVLSLFLDTFLTWRPVEYAFRGIRVCVVYLILSIGFKMLKKMKKNPFSVSIFASVTVCLVLFSIFAVRFSSVLYILICGAIGVSAYFLLRMREKKEGRQ